MLLITFLHFDVMLRQRSAILPPCYFDVAFSCAIDTPFSLTLDVSPLRRCRRRAICRLRFFADDAMPPLRFSTLLDVAYYAY